MCLVNVKALKPSLKKISRNGTKTEMKVCEKNSTPRMRPNYIF